jgi:hypothetical protein
MAKKKKTIDAEEEVVAIEPQSLEAVEPVAEALLSVKSRGRFIDGGLAEDFKKYGYSVNWKDGEVRNIPAWLYKKCLNSGGRFDVE